MNMFKTIRSSVFPAASLEGRSAGLHKLAALLGLATLVLTPSAVLAQSASISADSNSISYNQSTTIRASFNLPPNAESTIFIQYPTGVQYQLFNGSTQSLLTYPFTPTMAGVYWFYAEIQTSSQPWTAYASTSVTVTVPQGAPIITTQPSPVTVTAPASASFSVSAVGNPGSLTYQWQISTDGSTWTNLSEGNTYTAVESSSMTVVSTNTTMNNNQFRCVVSNSDGSSPSSEATLHVQAPLASGIPTMPLWAVAALIGVVFLIFNRGLRTA
jgi:hypothetical protein